MVLVLKKALDDTDQLYYSNIKEIKYSDFKHQQNLAFRTCSLSPMAQQITYYNPIEIVAHGMTKKVEFQFTINYQSQC